MLAKLAVVVAALLQAAMPLMTLDPRWAVTLETPAAAPAAYDAHHAYVPLRGGTLIAVDLDRGAIRWERPFASVVTPATGDDMVFVVVEDRIEAISTSRGEIEWRTVLPGHVTAVAWDTGWLLCGTDSGELTALRASDGTFVWRTSLGAPLVVPPAAALDHVYLGVDGGRVLALDLASGRQIWENAIEEPISALAATAGQLIVGTNRAAVSLELETGRRRWRWRVGGAMSGPATSDDRHIYFAARDNVVRAVDVNNGSLKWYAEIPSRPVGGPTLFQGSLLMPVSTAVEVFDPRTGKPVGTIAASGEISSTPHLRLDARPTAARLIATTRDGRMQGFGVSYEPRLRPIETLPGAAVVP